MNSLNVDHWYPIDHLHDAERDLHWYHLGYSDAPIYKTFYAWQRTVKLHYDYVDMPHDYFVLLHEADRLEMHRLFADHIAPQVEREIWLAGGVPRSDQTGGYHQPKLPSVDYVKRGNHRGNQRRNLAQFGPLEHAL